jgi:hypothetical protein
MRNVTHRLLLAAAVSLAIGFSNAARADSLKLSLDTSLNGSTPSGSAPWLSADFESTAAGTVTLTMTNNMPSAEFTPLWLFNVVSGVNPANLSFANVSGPVPTSATGGSTTGDSSIKAGTFTVDFAWTTSNNSNRFAGGSTVVETITDAADKITAASFNALSTGSQGGFRSAAKIQGISGSVSNALITIVGFSTDTTTSGTIVDAGAVPEPSSIILGSVGLLGTIVIAQKKGRRRPT